MWKRAILGSALLAVCANANPYNNRANDDDVTTSGSSTLSTSSKASSSSTSSSSSIASSSSKVTSSSKVSSSAAVTSSSQVITSSQAFSSSKRSSSSKLESTPSPVFSILPISESSSTKSSSSSSSASTPKAGSSSSPSPTTTTTGGKPSTSASSPSSSSISSSHSTDDLATCTGCALQAMDPLTTYFESTALSFWTSIVVTETVVTEIITYMDGASIDTVITEIVTKDQTQTLVVGDETTVSHTAPMFTVAVPGAVLTLDAGPTYLIYTSFMGGLDGVITGIDVNLNPKQTDAPELFCEGEVDDLPGWTPQREEDWQYFVQTIGGSRSGDNDDSNLLDVPQPVSVPPNIIELFKQDPQVMSFFKGSDIGTCTTRKPTRGAGGPAFPTPPTNNPPRPPNKPENTPDPEPEETLFPPDEEPVPTTPIQTYISKTYQTTSSHITRAGRLRAETSAEPTVDKNFNKNDPLPTGGDLSMVPDRTGSPGLLFGPNPTGKTEEKPEDKPQEKPEENPERKPSENPEEKTEEKPEKNPQEKPQEKPQDQQSPEDQQQQQQQQQQQASIFGQVLASIINNNKPVFTQEQQQQPTNPVQRIRIGDSVYNINPAQQTEPPAKPNEPNQPSQSQGAPAPVQPAIVIGSETLTPGETKTINGLPVVVPTGGGTKIIVDGSTVDVYSSTSKALDPTPTPVLTIGEEKITANPDREFVVGTETLKPGGPEITVGTNTLSLERGGTVAVINGATQTLVAPTPPPILTVNNQAIAATVIGGSTMFYIGKDQILAPGIVLTIDGTTVSMPSEGKGSAVVVNGVTSTLHAGGLPIITPAPKSITAKVIDGTTEFVLGSEQTLTPGGVVTFDGTTISMPAEGSGTAVVINGVTSTLDGTGLPVLTLEKRPITATVKDGTTEFILALDQTLTPGGVVTVDGTTFSMPKEGSGSTVVINGVTSTLEGYGLPVLTIAGQTVTASVQGGTTAYVVAPGQTLTPGGALVVSGTTFSMPESESGSIVVVNGVSSTIVKPVITAPGLLTIQGTTYTPTVRKGTTEYVLGNNSTLKAGEAVTISGTTYSLDQEGTALIVNGQTSTIPNTPAHNDATTTALVSPTSNPTATSRDPGDFIANGIGESSRGAGVPTRPQGLDKWAEGLVIAIAGWLIILV